MDDSITYLENLDVALGNLLQIVEEFRKKSGYRINIQKSKVKKFFIKTINRQLEDVIKEKISFIVVTSIPHLEMNFKRYL